MTRPEFAAVVALIEAGCGKLLPDASQEVYFSLLGDLPYPAFQAAAQQALLEHKYPTFPTIAMLRELASRVLSPGTLTAAEAWGLAWRAIGRYDPDFPHTHGVLDTLPPLVAEAVRCFGVAALCNADKPEVARRQWLDIYEQLAARDRRVRLLPAGLKQALDGIGREKPAGALTPIAQAAVARIGKLPTGEDMPL